ncbi:MAG: CPBP family intramembrane metalloprotease [Verrucomicrobia bacterium]|nr:CPBP family intramembrane metalloprotease [Verrucomicrobiota bacterium]
MSFATLQPFLYFLLGAVVLIAWAKEVQERKIKASAEGFWPGTTSSSLASVLLSVSGILLITLAESCVEIRYQVAHEQSSLVAITILSLLGAAVVEEIVFRGFVAPAHLTGLKLLMVVLIGSAVFALFHGFNLSTTQGKISFIFAFLTSVWLYFARFNPLNSQRSLLPCLVGHCVRNLAVFGIKWAQGFITFH